MPSGGGEHKAVYGIGYWHTTFYFSSIYCLYVADILGMHRVPEKACKECYNTNNAMHSTLG